MEVVRRKKRPGPGAKPRRVRITAVPGTLRGKTHDRKVYDATRVLCPPGVRRSEDTG